MFIIGGKIYIALAQTGVIPLARTNQLNHLDANIVVLMTPLISWGH
jgi:hypothetical protein